METLDSDLCIFFNQILPKKPELSQLGMFLIESSMQRNMRCRLAGVSDVVVVDARYHLKCYIQIQFTMKADCKKNTPKSSDPKDMCTHKVAHKVSIGVTKGEIYSLLDIWERSVGLLSKLMLAVTSSTGHDLTISCKVAPGEIEFVPQLGPI